MSDVVQIQRLSGSSPRPWDATFHPRLTVVSRSPAELRSSLGRALDAVVRGRISGPELAAAGLGGRVAVAEAEIALEDLVEAVPGFVASRIHTHADFVATGAILDAVRSRDHEAAVAAASGALEVAEADRDRAREQWSESRRSRSAQMADGWRARGEAARALRRSRRLAVDASEPAAVVDGEGLDRPATEVEGVASTRGDTPGGEVRELVHLRPEREATGRAGDSRTPAPTTVEERRALVDRKAQIDAELTQIRTKAPDRVIVALAHAERRGGFAAVEAAQVAVEWERVRDLVTEKTVTEETVAEEIPAAHPREARGGVPPPPPGPSSTHRPAASDRRREARDEVEVARRRLTEATSPMPADPRDVEALEAAHAEVLAAWEGSQGGDGGGRGRRRLEDAQQAEREILDRLGFSGYIELLVAVRAAEAAAAEGTDQARRRLAEAEARLAEVEAEAEADGAVDPVAPSALADEARGRLGATLDALRSRAADLLGEDPGPDVAGRLRERVATDPVSDLRMALDAVGLPLGEVLARAEVVTRARAWLAQQEDRSARRAALAAARVEVEERLARLDADDAERGARVAMGGPGSSDPPPRKEAARADQHRLVAHRVAAEEGTSGPDLSTEPLGALEDGAREAQPVALGGAISRLPPGAAADEQEDAADRDLGRAEAGLILARLEIAGLERIRESHRFGPTVARGPADVESLVWQILARLAAQRGEPGGPGATPLVLDEPFGPLEGGSVRRVCDALVGPSAVVQTIVFTDRPEVGEWLDAVGPGVAAEVGLHLADGEDRR